jgi:hypothetical protein
MPIEPDTKDWTWVLDKVCPECGFDAAAVDRDRMGDAVRANAAQWPGLLTGSTARLRPSDHQWSALEYGCHVRDVFELFDERLKLMLETDAPRFANWDQDVTAVEERYGEQDPYAVSEQLLRAAEVLAARWESVSGDQWERTGHRSDGATFTVDSFARYFLHDPVHHLIDVASGNATLAAASGER